MGNCLGFWRIRVYWGSDYAGSTVYLFGLVVTNEYQAFGAIYENVPWRDHRSYYEIRVT